MGIDRFIEVNKNFLRNVAVKEQLKKYIGEIAFEETAKMFADFEEELKVNIDNTRISLGEYCNLKNINKIKQTKDTEDYFDAEPKSLSYSKNKERLSSSLNTRLTSGGGNDPYYVSKHHPKPDSYIHINQFPRYSGLLRKKTREYITKINLCLDNGVDNKIKIKTTDIQQLTKIMEKYYENFLIFSLSYPVPSSLKEIDSRTLNPLFGFTHFSEYKSLVKYLKNFHENIFNIFDF